MELLENAALYTVGYAITRYNSADANIRKGEAITVNNAVESAMASGYHKVEVVYDQGIISYVCLYSTINDKYRPVKVVWDPECDFYASIGCCTKITKDEMYQMAVAENGDPGKDGVT